MVRALQHLLARATNLASADLPRFLTVLGGAGACAGLFLAGVYAWGTLHQSPDGRVAVVTPHRTQGPTPPAASPAPQPPTTPASGPAPLHTTAPAGSVLAARTGGNGAAAAPVTTQEPQPARVPSTPAAPAPTPSPAAPVVPALAPATAPPAPRATPAPAVSVGLDLGGILDLQLSL